MTALNSKIYVLNSKIDVFPENLVMGTFVWLNKELNKGLLQNWKICRTYIR